MDDDQFDRDLAQRLRAYEARIPDDEAPLPGTRVARRPPWAAFIGVGALGVVASGILALVLVSAPRDAIGEASPSASASIGAPSPSATHAPTPAESPVPTASTSETPTATTLPPAPLAGVAWGSAVAGGHEGFVRRITAEGDQFYALGALGDDAVIWSSGDGRSWDVATLPFPASWEREAPVFISASNLVASDGRLVAIGTVGALDNLNVVIWESTDGGSWREIDTGAFMAAAYSVLDVTAGPGGLVVVTHHYAGGTGSAWRSTDGGHTWTEHRPPGESVEAAAVVGTGAGYLIAGSTGADDMDTGGSPRIWGSDDGSAWTPLEIEGGDGEGRVNQLTVDGSGRWVAVGTLNGRAVAWRSEDGISWTIAADFRSDGPDTRGAFRLVGIPDGFLALDLSDPIVSWISGDGRGWTSSDQPMPTGLEGRAGWGTGIARISDTVVVVGEDYGPDGAGFGWFTWVGTIQR